MLRLGVDPLMVFRRLMNYSKIIQNKMSRDLSENLTLGFYRVVEHFYSLSMDIVPNMKNEAVRWWQTCHNDLVCLTAYGIRIPYIVICATFL